MDLSNEPHSAAQLLGATTALNLVAFDSMIELASGKGAGTCLIFGHRDLDGILTSVYISKALRSRGRQVYLHTLGNEDFDFETAIAEIIRLRPSVVMFFDISIHNYPLVIQRMLTGSKSRFFIYDHHLERCESQPSAPRWIYFNPTPTSKVNRSEPCFVFASFVAQQCSMQFPDWLAIQCIHAEGVAHHFGDVLKKLRVGCDERTFYRIPSYATASGALRAGLSNRARESDVFSILEAVADGKIKTHEDFVDQMTEHFGADQKQLALLRQRVIDKILRILPKSLGQGNSIAFYHASPQEYAVIGAAASIVRGRSEKQIIAAFCALDGRVAFEMRAPNMMSINLVELLSPFPFVSFGGHPTAVGGLIKAQDMNKFHTWAVERLQVHFEQ